MDELKPCPFCGCNQLWKQIDAWPRFIQCTDCGAEVKSLLFGNEAISEMIAKWNRRAENATD